MKYTRYLYLQTGLFLLLYLTGCKELKPEIPPNFIDESFWIRNKGADLFASVRGNPNSQSILINIHGGPATGAHVTYLSRPIAYEMLEEEALVVYYDQRGVGLSTGHFSEEKISLEQFVDDLDKVIAVVSHKFGQNKSIFLLCRSWGGMLGSQYLLDSERQNKIKGWIETNGAHDFKMMKENLRKNLIEVAKEQINSNNSVEAWQTIKKNITSYDSLTNSFQTYSKALNFAIEGLDLLKKDQIIEEKKLNSGLTERQMTGHSAYSGLEISWNDSQEIADKIQAPLINVSFTQSFSKIHIPTLFIWGRYDLIVPPILGKTAYGIISTSDEDKYLKIYENAGHLSSISAPKRFAQDVISFIQTYQ